MRVLFWGTPEFAIPSLRALLEAGQRVVGVVTRPDRPAGRGRKLRPSHVRALAEEAGLPVFAPEKPTGDAFLEGLRALEPDVSVVAAYGHILRPEVLDLPPKGSVNVHASLLPELRGAAPINWAVARGQERTGVTIMRMTPGMDEGPILLQREIPIAPDATASGLYGRLSELGADALVEALVGLAGGGLHAREQDHTRAVGQVLGSAERASELGRDAAVEVSNHVRGMDEVPGAWTMLGPDPLKLFRPRLAPGPVGEPGEVLGGGPDGLAVATGAGAVLLGEVQPAGKRRMAAAEWLRGRSSLVGERLS